MRARKVSVRKAEEPIRSIFDMHTILEKIKHFNICTLMLLHMLIVFKRRRPKKRRRKKILAV